MIRVNKNIWRGPEPELFQLARMRAAGVTDILDLETGLGNDGDLFTEQDVGDVERVRVWNLPLGAILPPTVPELASAAAFLEEIGSQPDKGIYVHCRRGVDRTGMVCAFYRIRHQGWSKQKAIEEMRATGMHWWYFWWTLFL